MNKKDIEVCMRIAWDESHYSNCLKKKVGASMFDDQVFEVVSVGCGGPKITCKECYRKKYEWQQDGCWSIHAEIRTMLRYFEDFGYRGWLGEMIIFTTHGPCDQCLKYMNYFGIPYVIYDIPYHNDYTKWKGKIEVLSLEEAYEFDFSSI